MRKTLFTQFYLLLVLTLSAQIPAGYYSAAEGKMDAALKTQLSSIITANYDDNGYDGLYNIYKTSDNLPSGKVWDMYSIKADGTASYFYSHTSGDQCGSYQGEADCYNREHTFCDSWLGKASPQRSDAHHIVPTDGYVNNRRSDNPHGKVGSVSWTSSNGSKLGSSDPSTGYSGTVFEPIDEFKGDFARMYFYVATRYESKIAGWAGNGSAGEILAGNSYPAYKTWFYTLMLQWHRLDPVSSKEINRNNAIFTFQKNRNPFIDYPDLAEYIWGNKKGQAWSSTATNSAYIATPANNSTLDFGKAVYQQTDTASVYVKAFNLTGSLTLTLSGTNQGLFSLSKTTLTKAEAETGYKLVINYNAQSVGKHTAQLIISGGGITSVVVGVSAESTDSFMALAASDITNSGFTARWTGSAGATDYNLDVYTLQFNGAQQTTKLLENDFTAGLPAQWSSSGYITNTDPKGSLRLASGSQDGSITTPAINLSGLNNKLTFKAKLYNSDTGAALSIKLNNEVLESFTTTVNSETYTLDLPTINTNPTITFSAVKGKRVVMDYVKIESVAANATATSITGYPLLTGNILSYQVTGLQSDSTYYYTVTPTNNSSLKSEAIQVKTLLNSALNSSKEIKTYWYPVSGGISLNALTPNSVITVFNVTGKQINTFKTNQSCTTIKLEKKGMYLINIRNKNNVDCLKVVY